MVNSFGGVTIAVDALFTALDQERIFIVPHLAPWPQTENNLKFKLNFKNLAVYLTRCFNEMQ